MHYNLDALRRSLGHFLVGKGASALCSVLLLVLLARWLAKEDYAAYVSLQALVVIVTYLTSLGINQSLLRYIPELRVANNNLPMYRMIRQAMAGRALTIGLGFLLVWAALEPLGSWLNLSHLRTWIPVYLLVGWVRIFNQFVGRIMESLLWQKQSQYTLALGSLVRLALVVGAALAARLDIPALFLIELASELLTLFLLLTAYRQMWHSDPRRQEGEPDWWQTHRQRALHYSIWSYLASLTAMLATSAPYRLISARFLAPEAVAVYGFASGIADMINRYTPTRLMQGTIRTILIARHSQSGDQGDLIAKLSLNYRINALILAMAAALMLACGSTILDWLTNGKYGSAAPLLAALLGVLLADVLRAQLELLAEVCERNQWSLAGNMAMVPAVCLAYLLADGHGLSGLILANAIGEILALAIMLLGMRAQGAMQIIDWRHTLPILALPLAGWSIGLISWPVWSPLLAASTSMAICFGLMLIWPPLSPAERQLLVSRLRKSNASGSNSPVATAESISQNKREKGR